MELTIALALSILGSVISVCSFALNRKDKSNKDTQNDSYKWGMIDTQIKQILDKLDKIDTGIAITKAIRVTKIVLIITKPAP